MNEDITREVAALTAIVSIALVGTAAMFLPKIWEKFKQSFQESSRSERLALKRSLLVTIIPFAVLLGTIRSLVYIFLT